MATTEIITDKNKIEEILSRGVHDVFTKDELREKLLSGKQLHIKLGTDVTGADLHLGHAVIHRKLRDFQELGHRVTLIIGDFTTLVGDHSDKVDMRKDTTQDDINKFKEYFKEQFFLTVQEEHTEIRHNSEWLKDLDFNDVIHLAKQFTIAQMLDRETFLIRYKEGKPIRLSEFLYPLMQGYDSVALHCDLELGGTDQTFNLLAGRNLMPVFDQVPQNAMTLKLLTGSDGRPMGKSLKNYIPLRDNAIDMYGKLMSIVDEVMWDYFELVTRIPMEEIENMKAEVEAGENPMKFKKLLAHEVTSFYHGNADANNAAKVFEETVQNKEVSEDIIEDVNVNGEMSILEFLKLAAPEASSGDIKRVIKQGGVEINGKKILDKNEIIDFDTNSLVKYGKRRYLRPKSQSN